MGNGLNGGFYGPGSGGHAAGGVSFCYVPAVDRAAPAANNSRLRHRRRPRGGRPLPVMKTPPRRLRIIRGSATGGGPEGAARCR